MRLSALPVCFALCSALLPLAAFGQNAERRLSFEVASVRPSGAITTESKRDTGVHVDDAQLDASMVSLADLVQRAYGLRSVELSAPGWMASARYDVHAKLPQGATRADAPAMLQTLLVDRFEFAFHREKHTRAVYVLLAGRDGPRLQEAHAGDEKPHDQKTDAGTFRIDRIMTISELCGFLNPFLDRPAVDQTGLSGTYHIFLDVPFDELKRAKLNAEGRQGPGDAAADPTGSSAMFKVVEQLGLKLEPRKMDLDILVVDHARKVPVEN